MGGSSEQSQNPFHPLKKSRGFSAFLVAKQIASAKAVVVRLNEEGSEAQTWF